MSHNLENKNGQYSFAYNAKNGLPWHGLGQAVSKAMTWQEAMKLANMDWTVSKHQLSSPLTGLSIPVWGIFRDDNKEFLGEVGGVYTPIQNIEAFSFVDALLEAEDQAHFDTAGVLGKGEKIFVSATIPYSLAPDRAPEDITNAFLMFTTSHDGSESAVAKLTTVRVVCNNTLNRALCSKGMGTLKVKHSASSQSKLDQAKKLLTGAKQSVSTLKEKFDILSNRKINKKASNEIMEGIFGKDWKDSSKKRNQIEKIAALFDNNDNNAFPQIKGSAYNMLNAVTNWVDHHRSIRETASVKGMKTDAIRTQSALFGTGDTFKNQALAVIERVTADCPTMKAVPKSFPSAGIPKSTFGNVEVDKDIEDMLGGIKL